MIWSPLRACSTNACGESAAHRMAAIERVAVLAALNLAHELQQTRHQGGVLGDEFDRTLGDSSASSMR